MRVLALPFGLVGLARVLCLGSVVFADEPPAFVIHDETVFAGKASVSGTLSGLFAGREDPFVFEREEMRLGKGREMSLKLIFDFRGYPGIWRSGGSVWRAGGLVGGLVG